MLRNRLATAMILTCVCVAQVHARGENEGTLRSEEFVVMGYQNIISELSAGEGPYLQTLLELLHTDPLKKSDSIDKIRSLAKAVPNIMDFADQVLVLQSEKIAALPVGASIYSGDKLDNALNHLTRGMQITVFLKEGGQFDGGFDEYAVRRLWIKNTSRHSFPFDDILAIRAPHL